MHASKVIFTAFSTLISIVLVLFASMPASGQATKFQTGLRNYLHPYNRARWSGLSVETFTGLAYYTGDLINSPAIRAENYLLNPAMGLGIGGRLTNFISLRGTFTMFSMRVDANNGSYAGRNFKSVNSEGSLMLIHDIRPKTMAESYQNQWNGYILVGIGLLRFEPRSKTTGKKLRDNPYDNVAYSNRTYCIPVGLGVTYHVLEEVNVGLEIAYRFTGTDFFDDAGALVASNARKDGYYHFGFKTSMQLYTRWWYPAHLMAKPRREF